MVFYLHLKVTSVSMLKRMNKIKTEVTHVAQDKRSNAAECCLELVAVHCFSTFRAKNARGVVKHHVS